MGLPNSPPNIVGAAFVCLRPCSGVDSGVGGALAGVLAGIGSGPTPYIAVLRPKKAWPSLGDLAESPSIDGRGKATYARYGSAASANIL